MRFINLSNSNKQAIVDAEDFDRLSKKNWCLIQRKNDRVDIMSWGAGKSIYIGREVLNYSGEMEVDHINRDTLDNRKQNLRFATKSQNQQNSISRKGSSSKFKGVYFRKDTGRWQAHITINYKKINLGCYPTEELAALAYNAAAIKYHDPVFVRLNEVPL